MSDHTIDLDAEAIFLDGNWYAREDFARRIKATLDSGDFQVARPSAALEQLTQELANIRTLAFRCPAELAEALMAEAQRQQKSVGAMLREVCVAALSAAPAETQGQGQGQSSEVAAPAVEAPAAQPAGDRPVELTKRKDGEPDEQRWFKA
jgi:hypothetical protein